MSHEYGPWVGIESRCVNCGKELEARRVSSDSGFVLEGLEPLVFRHADGTENCVIILKPSAFDIVVSNREYKRSLRDFYQADDEQRGCE